MAIEIRGLSRRFGDTQALQDVTLTLESGKIYGLLGNNGAGKSTLLNILTGRLRPTSGTVTVDGAEVGTDAAAGKLFLVGEENFYPEDMRVKGAFDATAIFYPDFNRPYAEDLAKQFGLKSKQKIKSLSTGYGSIFRLILGLSVGVPYVLLDEPVLGLDAQHRDLFYKLLLQNYGDSASTFIISTHLIAEVADIVEHTIIIRDGRILKNAPTETLTADVHTVSGPAAAVDAYAQGRHLLSTTVLGGLKSACVQGTAPQPLPDGLELSRLNLQDYFISLMQEEDGR
ncbi:MAG: ABC transporter ATP-binding protein [Oscillibacter sp.]